MSLVKGDSVVAPEQEVVVQSLEELPVEEHIRHAA